MARAKSLEGIGGNIKGELWNVEIIRMSGVYRRRMANVDLFSSLIHLCFSIRGPK